MKALVYKDLLAIWKYCRNYLVMCVVFLLASIFVENYSFLQIYPLIFMGMLINTLIAYDERDKWDRQVLTMPVTRRQYVTGKYLTGLILQSTVLLLTVAAHALQLNLAGTFAWETFWMDVVLMVMMGAAAPSLVLPFVFKNGSEKGRMAYLFVLAIVFALGSACMLLLSKLGMIDDQIVLPLPGILMAVAVLMYPASWVLSVHWYEKREF